MHKRLLLSALAPDKVCYQDQNNLNVTSSISFNGAWAQNLDKNEMFIDFLGDKGGARLTYGGLYEFCNGETLETEHPEYDIPNMYACEDRAFLDSITSGVKTKSNIDHVLESAKLLDRLYASAAVSHELDLEKK